MNFLLAIKKLNKYCYFCWEFSPFNGGKLLNHLNFLCSIRSAMKGFRQSILI